MRTIFHPRARRRSAGLLAAFLTAGSLAVAPTGASAQRLPFERVSVNSQGVQRDQVPSGSTTGCAMQEIEDPGIEKCGKRTISEDGTKAVFLSAAPNLVDGDTNGVADVFVADLTTGAVTRASVADNGAQADRSSASPSISPNGRYMTFESAATNLVAGEDKTGFTEVYVRDLVEGRTYLVSRPNTGGTAANGPSSQPEVANDGSVVFTSIAKNLTVPGEAAPSPQQVYVRRQAASPTAQTVMVSRGATTLYANGNSYDGSISADGARVAFTSRGSNLTAEPDGAGAGQRVFVATLGGSGAATTVSVRKLANTTTSGGAHSPNISPNGEHVTFVSEEKLTGDKSNTKKDVFVVSSSGGSVRLMSKCSCTDTEDRPKVRPSVSNSGAVVFETPAVLPNGQGIRQHHIWTSSGGLQRVSVPAGGTLVNDGVNRAASISGDGTKVVFTSASSQLVPNDRNGVPDVFVKELTTGAVTRISVGPGGREASGFTPEPESAPAVSGDGTIIAFESDSSNLVANDVNGVADIFIRNRLTGATERITRGFDGSGPNGASGRPGISADGHLVVFESAASNLVDGDTNGRSDVFVFDRRNGVTRRVSVLSSHFGGAEANGDSRNPSISPNGRYVAFESTAALAGEPARDDVWKIYRADLTNGEVVLISKHATRTPPQALAQSSHNPSVADNGVVAFESKARQLTNPPEPAVPGVRNWQDVYVADPTGRVTKVSVNSAGQDAAGGDSFEAAISGDGAKVAFASFADNLVPNDTNLASDIFVRDLAAGTTILVSAGPDGRPANGSSSSPAISRDGRAVTFASSALNLVGGGQNFAADIYLSVPNGRSRISVNPLTGAQANGPSYRPAISADGLTVAFHSAASNLVAADTNGVFDTFVRDLRDLPPVLCPPHCGPAVPPVGSPGGGVPAGLQGYWFVASDGGIFSFGKAGFHGSMGEAALNHPIVDIAATPSRTGYWLVASDGGIFSFGDAAFHGSTGDIRLNSPIVAMAPTPSGKGYWFVASDGGIFAFGDAGFYGSMGGSPLNRPIVGMAATPSGKGYWLVASDGGIFAYGDAVFHGSTGDIALNQPIAGMAVTPSGNGYRFVASDGGIFSFGDASFHGSMGGTPLNRPIVSMAPAQVGDGYWLVASDGGIFSFGSATFEGSTGDITLNRPIVAMAS